MSENRFAGAERQLHERALGVTVVIVAVTVSHSHSRCRPHRCPAQLTELFGSNTSRNGFGREHVERSVVEIVVGGREDFEDRGLRAHRRSVRHERRLRSVSSSKPDVILPPQL